MSVAKDGDTAAAKIASKHSSADERRDAVIADIMARVSLSELRELRMISTDRAGAFMSAVLRRPLRGYMLALNDRARIIGEKQIVFGPKWQAAGLTRELLSFAKLTRANKLIFGTSAIVNWPELFAFNDVYKALLSEGVTLVDIIEVKEGSFNSVFKLVSPDKSKLYKEFQLPKKKRG